MEREIENTTALYLPVDALFVQHDFRNNIPCCKICKRCGMAMHNTKYEGFNTGTQALDTTIQHHAISAV